MVRGTRVITSPDEPEGQLYEDIVSASTKMETYGGAAGSTLSTSTTMYIGAIEAVEFAQRLGLQSFKLVVKGDIVPQQILWLQSYILTLRSVTGAAPART